MATVPLAVVVHLVAAALALGLGAAVLALRKGTRTHRLIGRLWVAAIVVLAAGSFWITSDGHWSWIHGLSVYTLASLLIAVVAIRRGNVRAHRRWMLGTLTGLVVAGLFTLAPGRLLGSLLLGW